MSQYRYVWEFQIHKKVDRNNATHTQNKRVVCTYHRMRRFTLTFGFLLINALFLWNGADGDASPSAIEQKRKEILARRDSQKHRLNSIIRHMRKQLADHSAGEALLEPSEKEDIEKRLGLYVQKVESMKDYVDDDEVETTMAREESQRKYRTNSAQKIIEERKKEIEEDQKNKENRGEEL